jgi:hypothetical protein
LVRGPSKYFDKVTDLFSDYELNEKEDDLEPTENELRPERQISTINDWNGLKRRAGQNKDYIIEQWDEEEELDKFMPKKEIGLEEYTIETVKEDF